MSELVFLTDGKHPEPYTTSDIIAEMTGNSYRSIQRIIETQKERLETFGVMRFEITLPPALIVAKRGGFAKSLKPRHARPRKVEVIVQHGFLIVEDGQRDRPGQGAAIVSHALGSKACSRIAVGDDNIELRHNACVDILQDHIRENIGSVVDIPSSGQLCAVGFALNLSCADYAHILILNFGIRCDIAHPGNLYVAPVLSDKYFAFRTIDGILCE